MNNILFATPRSCSTHICDILGYHLKSSGMIVNNLYEYFNTYAWFYTYDQNSRKTVSFNAANSYYVDYVVNSDGIIEETVFKDKRIYPTDKQLWVDNEIVRRLNLLKQSEKSYLLKLFPLNLPDIETQELLKHSNVIALTRRDVIEQILSLYMVQLNKKNYNIRNKNLAPHYISNSIVFDPLIHQTLLIKNINRIREFNRIVAQLSLKVHFYEDLYDLNPNEILETLNLKADHPALTSRYTPINISGLSYYEIIKNKKDVNEWFETYAGDLI